MWQAVALSFGLAMDATAVSAARGLGGQHRRELAILPLVFGTFQSAMSTLGWLGGEWAGDYIAGWYRWVAFGLLALIGLKMIFDGWRGGGDGEHAKGTLFVYLALGVATSIDASVAGLTLPILPVSPWLSVLLIGVITAACSAVGYLAGRALGGKLGSRLAILGGVVLIGIGVSMLQH
jgi:putative Mn2+ efflux pump MntP